MRLSRAVNCKLTVQPCIFAGAFIPAVPVQPVVIRYPNKLVRCFIKERVEHQYMRHVTAVVR